MRKQVVSTLGFGIALAGGVALAQSTTPASAVEESTLEEIVVTAERRTVDLQRAPVAVSVRDGEDLRNQGRFTVTQILEDVPSVNVAPEYAAFLGAGDSPATAISIRAVQANGSTPGNYTSTVPPVALYVDGVYNGIGGDYDINRVEVLRGPQGTLYGRSATAGVVNIHTLDPTFDRVGGAAVVELGDYDLRHYSAAINLPAGDAVALRVAGNYYKRAGFDVPVGGQAGPTSDARVKLLFKPSDNLSVLLGFAAQNNRTHSGQALGTIVGTDSDAVSFDCETCGLPVTSGYAQTRQYWGQFDWNFGPATLTYIPALRTFKQQQVGWMGAASGFRSSVTLNVPHDYFSTQELRLTSNAGGPLQWQTGLFYYRNTATVYAEAVNSNLSAPSSLYLQASSLPENKLTENIGLYAEDTYAFTGSTRLTTGARGDYTKVQTSTTACQGSLALPITDCLDLSAQDGKLIWRNFTYKVRLEQDLTPDSLLYLSSASAFLPGDVTVTTGITGALVKAPYEAQTLTSFELGSKNRLLGGRLQINGSVFYYRYTGYQVTGLVFVPTDPQNPGGQVTAVFQTMSSPARMGGAELELQYRPTRADRFGLNLSYIDGHFVDQSALFASSVANSHIAGIVPWSVDPSYSHTFSLPRGQTLTFLAEVLFRSRYLVTNLSPNDYSSGLEPYYRNGDTTRGNLTATWNSTEKLSLSAYVRNLSNDRYKSTASVQTQTATLSEPRTYGVVLKATF